MKLINPGGGGSTVEILDIVHTATSDDDHALEIDCDAAGFADVKALDIDYITGAIGAGSEESVILVNIDESAATGGDIVALEVLTTSGGADGTIGLLAGAEIAPIEQLSGVFADMDSALVNAANELTDFTTSGGANEVTIFVADNDTVTIGNAAKFEEIEFLLAGFASKNVQPTFEFSTGVGTWTTFTPVDGTNGFLNNGVIAWLDADIPTWAVGTGSEYLIRITRTRNGAITSPIVDLCQIVEATLFYWDKSGDLLVNSISTVEGGTVDLYARVDGLSATPAIVKGSSNVTGVTTSVTGRYLVTHTALGSTNGAIDFGVVNAVDISIWVDDSSQSHTTTQTPVGVATGAGTLVDVDYSINVIGA